MRRKAKGGAGRGTPAPGSTASLLGETCLPATVRLLAGVLGCQQCCPHIDTWRNKSMALWKAADDQERMAKLLRQYRIRARDLNRAAYHSIGISPLHAAARAGNSDCVRLLLAHGAHVDGPGPDSDSFETPLMTTFSSEGQSWSAQHAVALALLDAGASVSYVNRKGSSALTHLLQYRGQLILGIDKPTPPPGTPSWLEILDRLLAGGADLESRCMEDNHRRPGYGYSPGAIGTPLEVARLAGHGEIVLERLRRAEMEWQVRRTAPIMAEVSVRKV